MKHQLSLKKLLSEGAVKEDFVGGKEIYIIEGAFNYEPGALLVAYETREQAEIVLEQIEKRVGDTAFYDGYIIKTVLLGGQLKQYQ